MLYSILGRFIWWHDIRLLSSPDGPIGLVCNKGNCYQLQGFFGPGGCWQPWWSFFTSAKQFSHPHYIWLRLSEWLQFCNVLTLSFVCYDFVMILSMLIFVNKIGISAKQESFWEARIWYYVQKVWLKIDPIRIWSNWSAFT